MGVLSGNTSSKPPAKAARRWAVTTPAPVLAPVLVMVNSALAVVFASTAVLTWAAVVVIAPLLLVARFTVTSRPLTDTDSVALLAFGLTKRMELELPISPASLLVKVSALLFATTPICVEALTSC